MEKVLVLGSNGFLGKNFQKYVKTNDLHEQFSFTGIDLNSSESNSGFTLHQVDITNKTQLEEILHSISPNYIINLVGIFNTQNFETLIGVNAGVSQVIFDAVLKFNLKVKKILLVGSAAEYGDAKTLPITEETQLNPTNFYGLSKAVQTQFADFYSRTSAIDITIARIFNIIGEGIPKSLSIGSFIDQINSVNGEGSIEVGNIETKRDFLPVDDVVSALWKLLFKGKKGETYNVCSGKSIKIGDILNHLTSKSGKSIKISINTNFIKKGDIMDSYGSNSKLIAHTGWTPKSHLFTTLDSLLTK